MIDKVNVVNRLRRSMIYVYWVRLADSLTVRGANLTSIG